MLKRHAGHLFTIGIFLVYHLHYIASCDPGKQWRLWFLGMFTVGGFGYLLATLKPEGKGWRLASVAGFTLFAGEFFKELFGVNVAGWWQDTFVVCAMGIFPALAVALMIKKRTS